MRHIHVFIALALFIMILPQNSVRSGNVGLIFHSMTSNGTYKVPGGSCNYFMKICLSLSENNCSLGKFTTKSWKIKPGARTIIKYGRIGTSKGILNPYRKTLQGKWNKQVVKLNASIWKESRNASAVFTEQHYFQTKLPSPVNKWPPKNGIQLTNCENHFCLAVEFYMWCEVLSDCIDNVSSSYIYPSSTVLSILPFLTSKSTYAKTSKLHTGRENPTVFTSVTSSTRQRLMTKVNERLSEIRGTASIFPNVVKTTHSTGHMLTTSEKGHEGMMNTTRRSNALPTVTQSFSREMNGGKNKRNKRNKLQVARSWWFLLSVIGGGFVVIFGVVVATVKCKKYRKSRVHNMTVKPLGTRKQDNNNNSSEKENVCSLPTVNIITIYIEPLKTK